MSRLLPFSLTGALAVLAACQAAPPSLPGNSPSPSATTSAATASASVATSAGPATSPGGSAAASLAPSSIPTISSDRELVLGSIYDDLGGQLDNANVAVTDDQDPSVNQTLQAPGSYAFRAPVGSTVTVTASRDGYTSRTRVHKVVAPGGSEGPDPNHLDFGGAGDGIFYALSEYPEITQISPSNQQKDVPAAPLVVKLTFSHPMSPGTRDRFNRLLQLHFQAPAGDQVVSSGFVYNELRATLEWDDSSKVATFTFPAPIVAQRGAAAAVTLGFDTSATASDWPQGDNGKRLGRDFVPNPESGTGAQSLKAQMAPILRDQFNDPVPVVRPSPLTLWGLTHWTDISFTVARDTSPLSITSVAGYPGDTGHDDTIEVTYNKPVRGFPEGALDGSAVRTDYYRFVIGSTFTTDAQKAYAAQDPATGGQAPNSAVYHASKLNVVELHLPNGTLQRYNLLKLFVDPRVDDINGVTLPVASPDPNSHLSANVVEGKIL